jgi:hypothetical protein
MKKQTPPQAVHNSRKGLRHIILFSETSPALNIVSTLSRELNWSDFKLRPNNREVE